MAEKEFVNGPDQLAVKPDSRPKKYHHPVAANLGATAKGILEREYGKGDEERGLKGVSNPGN